MKVATIDIGTNSMRLLLADYENENIVSNKKVAKVTKIGRGVDQNKLLSEQAINENVNVLEEFTIKIAFYQHERFVHLIVLTTTAILSMLGIGFYLVTYNNKLLLATMLLLILLIPYIFHYYFLENSLQKLYLFYDELLKK